MPGGQDVSNRRYNRFVYRWLKEFRKQQWRHASISLRDDTVAYDVAEKYLAAAFDDCIPKAAEFRAVMQPWIVNMIKAEGFPIHVHHRERIHESLTRASDYYRDVDKGLFGFSGIDTHHICESLVRDTKKLSLLLRRIHPDYQETFGLMLESAIPAMQPVAKKMSPGFFFWTHHRTGLHLYGSSL